MGSDLKINILRARRRTVSIRVCPDGSVEVKAPRFMSRGALEAMILQKKGWILKKQEEIRRQQEALAETPPLTEAEIRKLRSRARQVFAARAAYFAPLVGTDYGRISIRTQQTRFGSCSAAGNLNFNLALMLAPPEVLDYVVVHELCHRLEMNHSPRFWAEVERVLPDYRKHKRWLRQNGGLIIRRCTDGRVIQTEQDSAEDD